jgi:hypothetical protein
MLVEMWDCNIKRDGLLQVKNCKYYYCSIRLKRHENIEINNSTYGSYTLRSLTRHIGLKVMKNLINYFGLNRNFPKTYCEVLLKPIWKTIREFVFSKWEWSYQVFIGDGWYCDTFILTIGKNGSMLCWWMKNLPIKMRMVDLTRVIPSP